MRTAVILIWIAMSSLAMSADIWPAYEHPREIRAQMAQCYSGLVERAAVVGRSAPSAPAWYRTFRGDLDALKACLKDIAPFYVPTNTGGYYAPFTTVPTLTVTGLCAQVLIPTNFAEYSPPRSEIAGLGGFTDDATIIGHAHGYTNATTASGGPGLPAGRSRWYTTDYGLDALRAAISALAWTWTPPDEIFYTLNGGAKSGSGSGTWSAAKTAAASAWAAWPGHVAVGFGSLGYTDGVDFDAYLYGGAGSANIYHSYTNIPRKDFVYVIPTVIASDGVSDEFYGYDLGYGAMVEGSWCPIAESAVCYGHTNVTAQWGLELAGILSGGWVAEPVDPGISVTRGCEFGANWGVVTKWQFTYP